jgi:hypothetical protein
MYRATNRHGPFNGSQLSLNIPDRLHARGYNPPPNNQTKEISMANAQRGESANDEQSGTSARPVKSFGRVASRLMYGVIPDRTAICTTRR